MSSDSLVFHLRILGIFLALWSKHRRDVLGDIVQSNRRHWLLLRFLELVESAEELHLLPLLPTDEGLGSGLEEVNGLATLLYSKSKRS